MAKPHAESIHPRTKRVLDLRECERTRSCWVVKQFVELIIDYGKIKFKRYIRRGGEPADASEFGLLCLHYYYSLWVVIAYNLVHMATQRANS